MKKSKKTQSKIKQQPYDLLYGPHAIIEMLKAKRRRLVSIYTTKPLPKTWQRIEPYLPKSIPNTQYVAPQVLSSMAHSPEHAGLVALVSPFKYATSMFDPKKKPFILLLDGVQDVGNLGGILRSAYCTGVTGVVLVKKGGSLLTPATFKTSAGLAEYLDVYVAASAKQAVTEIKQVGYHLYMAVLEDGTDATKVAFKRPMCLVIGSEGTGISKDVRAEGVRITLPQVQPDISYNASVAAGILLFLMGYRSK